LPPGHLVTAEGVFWLREDGTPLPEEEHPVRRVLRTGIPTRNVVLGIAGNRVRWVLVNSLPLAPRPGSAPAGVVTTFVDITDHIHAQQLLRASEARYRGLMDSLPLMVAQFDRELNITFLNPRALATTGYTLEEVHAPAVWQSLVHPDDLPAFLEALREALAGKSGRCEVRYRAKDRQERFGYCLLQPLWGDKVTRWQGDQVTEGTEVSPPHLVTLSPGHLVTAEGVTALVLDMTRERRLEMELQRAQRLELVGRLSSGIAHDFNNLLTVLLGMSELAGKGLPANHPVQEDLQRINEVGEQAVNLAQQILAFSKQSKIDFRPVEVNRAVVRAVNILRTLLPRTIEVETQLAEGRPFIQADEMQLQQVLMNLCLNARDALPEGGRVVIRTALGDQVTRWQGDQVTGTSSDHPVTLSPGHLVTEGSRWLCLSVEDNGQGMTEEVHQRIFEPFFSTRERGTGLGLAIVHQIVTSFGGQVEVQSELGRGTCFNVWLPLSADDKVTG
jgi:PAS domain S-box-containing protein